eukprot:2894673-Rhodomonas_salina.2
MRCKRADQWSVLTLQSPPPPSQTSAPDGIRVRPPRNAPDLCSSSTSDRECGLKKKRRAGGVYRETKGIRFTEGKHGHRTSMAR